MINYNNVAISFVEDSAFHFFFQCHHSQNGIIRQITSYSFFIIYPMPARVSELFRFRSHILLVQRIKACNKFKNLDSKAALLLRKSPFWLCAINFRCTFYGAAEETGLIFKN